MVCKKITIRKNCFLSDFWIIFFTEHNKTEEAAVHLQDSHHMQYVKISPETMSENKSS